VHNKKLSLNQDQKRALELNLNIEKVITDEETKENNKEATIKRSEDETAKKDNLSLTNPQKSNLKDYIAINKDSAFLKKELSPE